MKGAKRKLWGDLIWSAALVETFPISLISVLVGGCQDQYNLLGCETQISENLPPAFWYSLFKWSGMAWATGSEHPADDRGSSKHLKPHHKQRLNPIHGCGRKGSAPGCVQTIPPGALALLQGCPLLLGPAALSNPSSVTPAWERVGQCWTEGSPLIKVRGGSWSVCKIQYKWEGLMALNEGSDSLN